MKTRRHKLIREIIEQQNIETQYQLTEALKGHGFSVTQATISRDIKELGLVKVATQENTFCYSFPTGTNMANLYERSRRLLRDHLLRVEPAHSLIVLHTHPGMAQGLASALDTLGWKEVAGTIAGDDTIFVAVREDADAAEVTAKLRDLTM